MLEAEIWGIAEAEEGYTVFVKPLKSNRVVPVFINQGEAQALLAGFGGTSPARPLTTDLLCSLAGEGGFKLLRAELSECKGGIFFCRLVFEKPGGEFVLDSRPSDALALAVRCKCPLFIAEKIVSRSGILEENIGLWPRRDISTDGFARTAYGLAETMTDTENRKPLMAELAKAVAAENYERAAEIRDLLMGLEKKSS